MLIWLPIVNVVRLPEFPFDILSECVVADIEVTTLDEADILSECVVADIEVTSLDEAGRMMCVLFYGGILGAVR